MCLGAIYWARPLKVYYGCHRLDAARIGFDDSHIYDQINIPIEQRCIPMANFLRNEAIAIFEKWALKTDRIEY